MTKLMRGRPIVRETAVVGRGEQVTAPIVVELHPTHMVIRLKGSRDVPVELTYQAVRQLGLIRAGRSHVRHV